VAVIVGTGVPVGSGVDDGILDDDGRLDDVGRTVGVGRIVELHAVNVRASSNEPICANLPATPPFWRRGARAVNVARRVTG
jgi:hypothetical protein